MIAAAVLAAGASRRLGRLKQLLTFRGESLVARATRAASASGVDATAVVLGANADAVARAVPLPVDLVHNDAWTEGIASSVRAAVDWAEDRRAAALVVVLADQPLVSASHVARLVRAWRSGAQVAASSYGEALGAPAVFDASVFPALRRLSGDAGAARVLRGRADVLAVQCADAAFDVDTPADLDELRARDDAPP